MIRLFLPCPVPCERVFGDIECACALCVSIGCSQHIHNTRFSDETRPPLPNPGAVRTYAQRAHTHGASTTRDFTFPLACMRLFFADRSWFSICFVVSIWWGRYMVALLAKANTDTAYTIHISNIFGAIWYRISCTERTQHTERIRHSYY